MTARPTSHGIAEIRIADIVVAPERMRKLRADVVDSLAESITKQGLLQPIVVRPRGATNYWLIAGRHRLEAVRQCGRNDIRAVILDGIDADAALLAEIDENLIRCDLSPAEWALHIARRKELYEKLHPETRHGATGRGRAKSRQNDDSIRFTNDAANKTGRSERTVQREIERAKISGLADVIGTPLDAADELDALAKLPESTQRDLIARARTGEKVIAKHAARRLRREARERELAAATESASETLGKKLYGVIYADPPWKFIPYADSWDGRLADDHYPCLPTDAIKTLTIPAADDGADAAAVPRCHGGLGLHLQVGDLMEQRSHRHRVLDAEPRRDSSHRNARQCPRA